MTADQAKFLAEISLEEFEAETKTTRRVLAAVPDDKGDYAPDGRSMNTLTLAFHIAEADVMLLEGVAAHKFGGGEQGMPPEIKTPADVVARYDARLASAVAKVKAMSGEALATPVDFYSVLNLPAVRYLSFITRHSVHHRGQLSAYLRPMGAKVPSIYGPSADES
jgi:uncharacterized damage-inducible protein DinB